MTCHNIYCPKNLFQMFLKGKKQWENCESIARQRQYQKPTFCKLYTLLRSKQTHSHGPICCSTFAEGLAEVHRAIMLLQCLEARLGAPGGRRGVAKCLARQINHCSLRMDVNFPKRMKLSKPIVVPL